MTTIERTAYPRFKKTLSSQELKNTYSPTPAELTFIRGYARTPQSQLNLLVSLKCFQRLGYFPLPETVPTAIVDHIRQALHLPPSLSYTYPVQRTLYRHRTLIQDYLQVTDYANGGQQVATAAIEQAAQVMNAPADLVSAAVEELVRQRFELPAFSTLDHLAQRIRTQVNDQIFTMVNQRLSQTDKQQLDLLLEVTQTSPNTPFVRLKQPPPSATFTHMRAWEAHLAWLDSLLVVSPLLAGIAPNRIQQFAAEAYALEPFNLRQMTASRRYTLLLCLLHQMQVQARDSLVEMFIKRLNRIHQSAREQLELIREQQRSTTENLVDMVGAIAYRAEQNQTNAELGRYIRTLLDKAGGAEAVRETCEAISAYHNNNYLPLLWSFYRTHRQNLFRLLDLLDIQPTTQDQALIQAIEFTKAHRHLRRAYLPDTLPLDFASTRWRTLIYHRQDGQRLLNRRHLEVCVFSYLATELQTGDMAVTGSEQYADYRDQLLPWNQCQPLLPAYCQTLGLPDTAKAFVQHLRDWLTEAAAQCDNDFPDNAQLTLKNGRPSLKRLKGQPKAAEAEALRQALVARLPSRSLLQVLVNVQYWVNYLTHFGPLSGSSPKLHDAIFRYILTVFGYGCNLGPTQTARHIQAQVTPAMLAFVNHQHITLAKLDAAIRDIINHYARFELPRYWGLGQSAAADGTLIDLYANNLLAEYHLRYGGYGGIAYYHVADNYIALFSHFIACGLWEAIYIIDGLLKNQSDIQPNVLHADTQGQSEPVFGLAHLLGINLMPRIRNWKDLTLYRPTVDTIYQHIDDLFTDTIDWLLLETHWQDLMQVVISIQQGKILPSMLLRKLGHRSRKNRLYRAFRELGRVVRTVFLLKFISDPALRRQITAATNKVEAYNGFTQWIRFGDQGIIKARDPLEQEKRVKYTNLVANALILQNVADMTRLLPELAAQGYTVNQETLARLSPYPTSQFRRFGDYVLDLNQIPEPLLFDLSLDI